MDMLDAYPALMTLTDLVFTESGHGWVAGQSGGLVLKTYFPVTIEKLYPKQDLSVYPNPVKDVLNIQSKKIICRVELYDLLGNSVFEKKTMQKYLSIQTNELKSGIYSLRISLEGGAVVVRKVIVNGKP